MVYDGSVHVPLPHEPRSLYMLEGQLKLGMLENDENMVRVTVYEYTVCSAISGQQKGNIFAQHFNRPAVNRARPLPHSEDCGRHNLELCQDTTSLVSETRWQVFDLDLLHPGGPIGGVGDAQAQH